MSFLKMLGITFILLNISTFSLVASAYYSDKNYKKGKNLWKIGKFSGLLYSISALTTLIMGICKLIDFLF